MRFSVGFSGAIVDCHIVSGVAPVKEAEERGNPLKASDGGVNDARAGEINLSFVVAAPDVESADVATFTVALKRFQTDVFDLGHNSDCSLITVYSAGATAKRIGPVGDGLPPVGSSEMANPGCTTLTLLTAKGRAAVITPALIGPGALGSSTQS